MLELYFSCDGRSTFITRIFNPVLSAPSYDETTLLFSRLFVLVILHYSKTTTTTDELDSHSHHGFMVLLHQIDYGDLSEPQTLNQNPNLTKDFGRGVRRNPTRSGAIDHWLSGLQRTT